MNSYVTLSVNKMYNNVTKSKSDFVHFYAHIFLIITLKTYNFTQYYVYFSDV